MKAVPPASALFGSPARVGKLLQRNAEPPWFNKQSAALGSSAPASGFVVAIRVSCGAVQLTPPSPETSSYIELTPPLQSAQATISSPLALNAAEVPLPHSWFEKLIDVVPNVQLTPPLSLTASSKTALLPKKRVHATATRP